LNLAPVVAIIFLFYRGEDGENKVTNSDFIFVLPFNSTLHFGGGFPFF
jgi:hypothetical protein